MTIRPIITGGDPILKTVCKEVELPRDLDALQDLMDTARGHTNCRGLAAPQIGHAIRAWLKIKQPAFAQKCCISHSALADFELDRRDTTIEVKMMIARYVASIGIGFINGVPQLVE